MAYSCSNVTLPRSTSIRLLIKIKESGDRRGLLEGSRGLSFARRLNICTRYVAFVLKVTSPLSVSLSLPTGPKPRGIVEIWFYQDFDVPKFEVTPCTLSHYHSAKVSQSRKWEDNAMIDSGSLHRERAVDNNPKLLFFLLQDKSIWHTYISAIIAHSWLKRWYVL